MTLPREEHDDRDGAAPVSSEPDRERSAGEPESVPAVRWPRPDLLFPALEETAPPGPAALRPEAPAPAPASPDGPPTQAMPIIQRAAERVPVAAPTEPEPVREPEAPREPEPVREPEPAQEAEAVPGPEPDSAPAAIVVPEPPRRRRGVVGVFFEGVKLVLVVAMTAVLVAGLVAGAFALLAVVLREAVS